MRTGPSTKRLARLLSVTIALTLSGFTVLAGAPGASAIPNGDWVVIDDYAFSNTFWSTKGRIAHHPGNWHTGNLELDGDDDGITGALYDWSCPKGVTPPRAYADTPTTCTLKRTRGIEKYWYPPLLEFDSVAGTVHIKGRLDVVSYDPYTVKVDAIPINLTVQGVGDPVLVSESSPGGFYESQTWSNTRVVGRVGKTLPRGPRTTREPGTVFFYQAGFPAN